MPSTSASRRSNSASAVSSGKRSFDSTRAGHATRQFGQIAGQGSRGGIIPGHHRRQRDVQPLLQFDAQFDCRQRIQAEFGKRPVPIHVAGDRPGTCHQPLQKESLNPLRQTMDLGRGQRLIRVGERWRSPESGRGAAAFPSCNRSLAKGRGAACGDRARFRTVEAPSPSFRRWSTGRPRSIPRRGTAGGRDSAGSCRWSCAADSPSESAPWRRDPTRARQRWLA